MSTVYSRGVPRLDVAKSAGTVDSVVADYSGDLAIVYVQIHDTAPKSVLTLTGVGVADEVVTIGSNVYTLKAAPTTVANEVKIGASAAATAANLVAAIGLTGTPGTDYGSLTVINTEVSARVGAADPNDLRDLPGTQVTIEARATTGAVATTTDVTGGSFSVATLPRLAATDVPTQTTALRRFSVVTTASQAVSLGAIVVLSSTENTYTPVTYDDIYNGTTPEDRVSFSVEFSVATTSSAASLSSDADVLFDYKFDGDLTDELGGSALVKSGGTDLFIPSPVPARALAYRASVEHCEHAANEATLELTGAMTLHMYIRRTAATDSVFLTFGNGVSAAAANNHLFTVAIVDATGALIWSQENGSGTNSADTALPVLTSGEWVQVTYTRPTAATSVKLYLNGYLADTSAAITAPTGGTAGVLTVGGTEGSVDAPMDFASLTIFGEELTAAQVLAHCNRERGI